MKALTAYQTTGGVFIDCEGDPVAVVIGCRAMDARAMAQQIVKAWEAMRVAAPVAQPLAPSGAVEQRTLAGSFVYEGNCWVATSSDDPRATKLYRAAQQPADSPGPTWTRDADGGLHLIGGPGAAAAAACLATCKCDPEGKYGLAAVERREAERRHSPHFYDTDRNR